MKTLFKVVLSSILFLSVTPAPAMDFSEKAGMEEIKKKKKKAGKKLSEKGKKVIQKMLKGEKCDFESSKLSKREWNELMESFGFKEKIV